MCTTYCHKQLKKRNKHAKQSQAIGNWKPSYIPFKEQNTIQFRDTSNFSDNKETRNKTMFSKSKRPTHHFKYKKSENITSFTSTTIKTDTYSTITNLPPKISITTPLNIESPMSSVVPPLAVTVLEDLKFKMSIA